MVERCKAFRRAKKEKCDGDKSDAEQSDRSGDVEELPAQFRPNGGRHGLREKREGC